MFTQLVMKEIKYQLGNITFYLLIAVVLLFYSTQFIPELESGILEPRPGMAMYGYKEITDQETEIKAVYLNIYNYYNLGYISKQGLLINKDVRLSEEQKIKMKEAMDKLAYIRGENGANSLENIEVKASYDEYLKVVRNLDKYLGGSTYYGDKYRKYILKQPMTYEDAKMEFEDIKIKDKITNAYGRLFADYMGITAGLFPIFLSAFVLTRDKRSRMQELIYSRSISSIEYIGAKYCGILIILIAVYLVVAAHATVATLTIAQQLAYGVEWIAFFKYTVAWLIPTIMFSTAMGILISLLFNNGVAAIFMQFMLWLVSISSLGGNYELYRNVIRYNTLGSYDKYVSWLPQITANRVFYSVLSLAMVAGSAWIFSLKRGARYGFKNFNDGMVQRKDIA